MRIHLMSDLHVEFGPLDKKLPEGDVLLLAGDTTVVKRLGKNMHDHASRSLKKATQRLNDEISKKFNRAYAVAGNHEGYGGFDYRDVPAALAEALPAVTVLDCDHVLLSDDVILFGAPLWTDMGGGNPLSMLAIKSGMMDFDQRHGIRYGAGYFTPDLAVEEFRKAMAYLTTLAENNRSKTIVVLTHHAPSRQGTDMDFPPNVLDGAYYTSLEPFIMDHPNIRFWAHGHTHIRKRYQIAQCQLLSNARGYRGMEFAERSFDPDVSFVVDVEAGLTAVASQCSVDGEGVSPPLAKE